MRKLCLVLVAGALLIPAAPAAAATVPDGPRLALARSSIELGNLGKILHSKHPHASDLFKAEVFTTDAFGGTQQTLIGGSLHKNLLTVGAVSWSPDGSTLALEAAGLSTLRVGPESSDIYLIGADGSGLRRLTTSSDAVSPVFSADGKTIFFQRLKSGLNIPFAQLVKHPSKFKHLKFGLPSSSIWAINADGTGLRRITPTSKKVAEVPTSVSPLTGDIAVTRSACTKIFHCKTSADLLSPATGAETVLLKGGGSPVFSPDGKKVALGSYRDRNFGKKHFGPTNELYVLDLGTGALQRLTYSPGIDESLASWDPTGSRLAYIRSSFAGFEVREINADGTCVTPIAEPHGIFSRIYTGVAWQPGVGRGAGPIAC
jgi:dipeptidyl aminopeptidase/acylaminoacyl peptidase